MMNNDTHSTLRVRPMAMAGSFYPQDAQTLRAFIDSELDRAVKQINPAVHPPRAVIAPHAGYVYSGPVAASVYARLIPAASHIRRVMIVSPAHRVPVIGLAASDADAFETPLGLVMLDRKTISALCRNTFVHEFDQAHTAEHGIEVHLPFLQKVLDDFELIPLVFGDVSSAQIQQVFEQVWDDDRTLIVVSSDLSHFYSYDTAYRVDNLTRQAIEKLDPVAIQPEQACGSTAIQALLMFARQHDLKPHTLDLRNSGDTAGSRESVVGYGAFAFETANQVS